MFYGVVAPGISTVYENYEPVRRILALYPYTKVRKFKTQDDAWRFVRRYKNTHIYDGVYKYGDTFSSYVKMEYFIGDDALYYNFRTKHLGYVRIVSDKAIIQNKADLIMAKLENVSLNSNMITGHLIAIYHGLQLLGDFIDVDITVPDHSIFYALMTYSGNNQVINKILTRIRSRLGKISVTLLNTEEEEITDD